MSTVIVSATVKDLIVDATVKVGGYKVSVTGLPDQLNAEPSGTFLDVGPGTFTATIQRVDVDGNSIGGSSSAVFTIAAPTQTIQTPDVVSVTVTP